MMRVNQHVTACRGFLPKSRSQSRTSERSGGLPRRLAIALIILAASGIPGLPAAEYVEPKWTLENCDLTESSGLAASSIEGIFWTHNDGSDGCVFAFDTNGANRGVWKLKHIEPSDIEDMCSFKMDGQTVLLLADTGNNEDAESKRSEFKLYLIDEPKIPSRDKAKGVRDVSAFNTIRFRYEDSRLIDCESVTVDVSRKQIILIDKPKKDAGPPYTSNVYSLDLVLNGKEKLIAKHVATMPAFPERITGLDISRAGPRKRAIVLTYLDAYEFVLGFTWKETLANGFEQIKIVVEETDHPRKLTFREAICYGLDSHSLYLTRELSEWERRKTHRRTPAWKIR